MFREKPWLDPVEARELVRALLELNVDVFRWSNDHNLPLKSGGMTDIYVNVRNARNSSEAMRLLANAFEMPMRRLGIQQFVEVPDAVSCLAGPLSERLGLPYVTVREQAKAGRVVKGKLIGSFIPGARKVIFDDVITDGASKVVPFRECPDALALLVLCDRQQGWKQKFAELGIDLSVWAGFTLHDLRRMFIQDFGIMQRCKPEVEEENPIIIALDGKSWEEILVIVDPLRTSGCILKVNDLLFNKGIEWLLPNLSVYGRVMADLKEHDIGNTLSNITRHLRACPPWAVTVHASAGEEAMRAVVQALEGTPTKVLAVTVLTSIKDECEEIYHRLPLEQVKVLAAKAHKAGVHGFVCSPEETAELRGMYPTLDIVNPGVRSPGADAGDQKRVGTPHGAMDAGATNLVMGRQILGASDPVAEVRRVLREELGISI